MRIKIREERSNFARGIRTVLEGLDQIDWATLGDPQVPIWIRQLASKDVLARGKASGDLQDELMPWPVFDGDYRELLPGLVQRKATHLMIPFLLEMLESPEVKGKYRILGILHDLAWFIDLDKYVAENEREQYHHYAQQLYGAVYKGIEMYRELAKVENYELSQAAKDVLKILDLGKPSTP